MYVVCSCVGWNLCRSRLITIGECERTHAPHGKILHPSISSAAPDASARASVGAPQVAPRLVHVLMCVDWCEGVCACMY